MRSKKCLAAAFLAVCLLPLNTRAQMTVVELFTTPYCSYCPPADKIFKSIVDDDDENVIGLSCHVDYYNSEEEQDPLSNELCTDRHASYFINLDLDSVATPQMVINGTLGPTANKEESVADTLKTAKESGAIKPVRLSLTDGKLEIVLPPMDLSAPVDLWLMGYDRLHSTELPAGTETLKVDYANALRHIEKLAEWNGDGQTLSHPATLADYHGYALLAQQKDFGAIIAAGKIEKE